MQTIALINGPNLNILDKRGPTYGNVSLKAVEAACRVTAEKLNLALDPYQSNHEGEIVERIQSSQASGMIINPAAYTHTSVAILDALYCFKGPIIEVHITNILASKEPIRRLSITANAVSGVITGLGTNSYLAAIEAIKLMLENRT